MPEIGTRFRRRWLSMVQQREQGGNEDQRGDRRQHQPADHRPAERRILFAALAKTQRHRDHADDHRERGHQHRTEAREARLNRRPDRVAMLRQTLPREGNDENAVGG